MSGDKRYATDDYREAATARSGRPDTIRLDQAGTDTNGGNAHIGARHRIDVPSSTEPCSVYDITRALPPSARASSESSEGTMMPVKIFRVASGYEVVKGYVTYGAGLMLDIEQGETIRIFETSRRTRARSVGTFSYSDLRATKPPRGLTIEG
jgi:hypothetical protein